MAPSKPLEVATHFDLAQAPPTPVDPEAGAMTESTEPMTRQLIANAIGVAKLGLHRLVVLDPSIVALGCWRGL